MWHMTHIDCNKEHNKALWQDLSHTACTVWKHRVQIDWELLTTTKVLNRSLSAYLAFMYSVQFFCSVQYLVYDPNSSPNCHKKNPKFYSFYPLQKKSKKISFSLQSVLWSFKKLLQRIWVQSHLHFFEPFQRAIKISFFFSFVNIWFFQFSFILPF